MSVARVVEVGKPDNRNINTTFRTIEFHFNREGQVVDKIAKLVRPRKGDSELQRDGIPWAWHNAQSLISTGDWIILADRDMTADTPKGGETLEGGAW